MKKPRVGAKTSIRVTGQPKGANDLKRRGRESKQKVCYGDRHGHGMHDQGRKENQREGPKASWRRFAERTLAIAKKNREKRK